MPTGPQQTEPKEGLTCSASSDTTTNNTVLRGWLLYRYKYLRLDGRPHPGTTYSEEFERGIVQLSMFTAETRSPVYY